MAFVNSARVMTRTESALISFLNYRIFHRTLTTSYPCRSPVNLAYASYETTDGSGGNIANTSSVPVLIMHGLFGSKNNWNTLAKAINQKTQRKVIAVDARNHGESPHSSSMSYPDMAEDVLRLLENLEIERAILVGHSMGGSTMMCAALNYPSIVEKLVVVDMSPVRTSSSLAAMGQIFDAMLSIDINKETSTLSETRKAIDQQLAKNIHSDTLRQFLLMNLVEYEPGKYKWRVNLPILAENFAKKIAIFPKTESKSYDGPTLFIGGANSDYIRKEDHSTIKNLFPEAEFHYIKGAGHWVQSEKPAEFLEMIVNFINKK